MKKNEGAITIAIDGPSSTGKSTLARRLAQSLGFVYIDSGAMYRAIALYSLQNYIQPSTFQTNPQLLDDIDIRFESSQGTAHTFLNDKDVSVEIRNMAVSKIVSEIAAISTIRRKLVSLQKSLGTKSGVVMDGRDIGTVVFPDAEIKFYLDCSLENRVRRRFLELQDRGYEMTLEQVRENLLHRDKIDSTREDSPLRPAHDAIHLDNSSMSLDETLEKCLQIISDRYPKTARLISDTSTL